MPDRIDWSNIPTTFNFIASFFSGLLACFLVNLLLEVEDYCSSYFFELQPVLSIKKQHFLINYRGISILFHTWKISVVPSCLVDFASMEFVLL